MKKYSVYFLGMTIVFVGLIVLVLCIFSVPAIANGLEREWPELAYLKFTFFLVPYASAVPFYTALYQALKLLSYIKKGNTFSMLSVKALKIIKYCGAGVSFAYALGLPTMFCIAQADDAPGLILFTCVIILIPLVVSVFAALLEALLREAVAMKNENDFTV